MNRESEDFFCFILPDGIIFPCAERDGGIDFPWGKSMEFVEMARGVFSSHQIDNAFGYLSCDEITKRFKKGERSLEFMYEVSSYASMLRKRWDMDK